ncbi:MAG: Ig-like domain-containing protein [Gemmatimonadota bacterium]|jgi:serine/threonine-protein kinase
MERTASCPSCRRGIFVDDEFCAWCGTAILADTGHTDGPTREQANASIGPVDRLTCGSCNHQVLPGDLFCASCGARCATGEEPADGIGESVSTIAERVTEASDGRYEVIRLLGRGGMGVVLMARDLDLGRLVAIKALSPSWLSDESMVGRFQREARTIASLRHESIVSVYDRGRAGEYYYFVMDFIEGVPLSEIIRANGSLTIPVVKAVLYQVGSALDYAHGRSSPIVHRDIKPANIMLDADGLAVVMDFGISKVSESASGLTRTGIVMGTPEYMSPEQCRGPTVTHESDQYSLGAVAFAMLTGAPPFTGPYYQVLMAHQSEPVRPLAQLRPDCPSDLAAAVERMLAKVPGDRWPTIGDMLHELELRPLPRGNPARREIGRLVRESQERKSHTGARSGAPAGFTRTPTSLRIEPQPSDLEVGDDIALSAVLLFPDGDEEAGSGVSWESTDPSIARIDPDTGRLVAVGAGSVEIRAALGTVSESVPVSISPPRVIRVSIEPDSPEVEVGSAVQLRARATTKKGAPLERPVSWSSSDPRTASIDDDGRVTGHREGTASILAHCEGVGGATQLTVRAAPVQAPTPADEGAGVAPTLVASAETVAVDSRYPRTPSSTTPPRPRAEERGKAPPEAPAKGKAPGGVPWVPVLGVGAVAVVLIVGWLALRGLGGGASVQEVRLVGDGAELGRFMTAVVGDTVALTATALDEGGNTLDEEVEWSSEDPSVASFLGGGRLVAVAEGTTRVHARAGGTDRALSVNVGSAVAAEAEAEQEGPGPVARIVLRRPDGREVSGPLSMRPRETVRLQAAATDDDDRDVPGTFVLWESTAPTVAAVDSRGTVTAIQDGRADIVASAEGIERRIQVRVTTPAEPPPRDPEPPRQEATPVADGTLQLIITPFGDVWIDGAQVATEQNRFSRQLRPGSHRLRLERAGAQPFDTTITIRSGQITRISKSLNR